MTDKLIDKVTPLIQAHEGLRLKPYTCTAGKLTIGYGRNLEDVGVSKKEALILLTHDIDAAIHDVKSLFTHFETLSLTRQAVLVDMMFNLGLNRLKGFKKMIYAVETYNFENAAFEMLNSKWAVQVGARATTLANMMAHGL